MDSTSIQPPSETTPEAAPTEAVVSAPPPEGVSGAPTPGDPYAAYADLDYEAMMVETPVFGITADELRTVYGPAHTAGMRLGLEGFEDDYELGSRGDVLRGLAAYQRDYDVLRAPYDRHMASLPPGTKVTPPAPLAGEALERAIRGLATQYFPRDATLYWHRIEMP